MSYWKTYGTKGVSLAEETRYKLQDIIKDTDNVLDVGSAKCVFTRANYIVDMLKYDERSTNKYWGPKESCFSENTWVVSDINDPLPFDDNFFDFSLCTHTLEDIKDPLRNEFTRVKVEGKFLNEKEMFMPALSKNGNNGFHILVVLKQPNGKNIIFDTGWIPTRKKNKQERMENIDNLFSVKEAVI